jgi:hypothetical protein
VNKLALFLEQRIIKIPSIETIIDELESFGYQISDAGNIKYGAPEGFNDDCVMSLALSIWQQDGQKRQELTKARNAIPAGRKRFQYL